MDRYLRRVPGEPGSLRKLPDLPPYPFSPNDGAPAGAPDDTIDASDETDDEPVAPVAPEPGWAPPRRGTAERPLRVGVIGVGMGAAVHVPALVHMPETELIAVCARRTNRVIPVAAQYEVPLVTTDFRQVVNESSIEAVIIATPPHLHHQMVIAALEAGKHVLCETPMARSLAESRDMARMAANAGVVAMVNHQLRFEPVRARIKSLLDSGYIGVPQAANLTVFRSTLSDPYSRPFSWHSQLEQGGGMLGSIGSHEIDSLRWWLGEVESVAGIASTMVDRRITADGGGMARVDADDNFAFVLRFASGTLGTVHVTTTSGVESGEEILLSGSEGMLIAQSGGTLLGARRGESQLVEIVPNPEDDHDLPPSTHPMMRPTYRLMQRWVAAIRDGAEAPSPSFQDGAKAQEIMDGVRKSGHQGRWIDTSGKRFHTAIPRHVSI